MAASSRVPSGALAARFREARVTARRSVVGSVGRGGTTGGEEGAGGEERVALRKSRSDPCTGLRCQLWGAAERA